MSANRKRKYDAISNERHEETDKHQHRAKQQRMPERVMMPLLLELS